MSKTTKTASIDSITNQNQGGGNKKAGMPSLVGRNNWFPLHVRPGRNCCGLTQWRQQRAHQRNVSQLANLRFTSSMGVDHW